MNVVTLLFLIFIPIVTTVERPESKYGWAPSSHSNFQERAAQLPDIVTHWRGWQRTSPAPNREQLKATQAYWCDFYFHPIHSNGILKPLDGSLNLGKDFDGVLLFLNEPDLPGQCTVSPERGAQLYVHVKNTLPNAKLVGPGISEVDWINNFKWLNAFFKEVTRLIGKNPEFYAWDIHNYQSAGNPIQPYNDLENFLLNKNLSPPIRFYISEWGACTPERIIEMRNAFDSDQRIIKHYIYDQTNAFWDGPGRCIILFDEKTSQLTDLGRAWLYGLLPANQSARSAMYD